MAVWIDFRWNNRTRRRLKGENAPGWEGSPGTRLTQLGGNGLGASTSN